MALKRVLRVGLAGFWLLALLASPVLAQSGAIAGEVKDATGAVLPGVTVEAASPALIEKVRTVVTNEQGLYNIINLRPGVYDVTFSLPSFSTVKREGVELTAGFTATINAELRIGAIEETLTVTGATPTVDIQNVTQQKVMTRDIIDALPTGTMSYQNLAVLIPGVIAVSQDVGGTSIPFASVTAHGSRQGDTTLMSDGMYTNTGASRGGGNNGPRLNNTAAIQEVSLTTGGLSAENEMGGVRFEAIQKEGSNQFHGVFYGSYAGNSMQSDNLTDDLRARGLTSVDRAEKIFNFNPGFGGPVLKDKLWFYVAFKKAGGFTRIPGIYYNKSTSPFAYVPDLDRPAVDRQWDGGRSGRLTWQINQKNKLNFQFIDTQGPNSHYYGSGGDARLTAPEAITRRILRPYYMPQVSWSAPVTNRILVEAGVTYVNVDYKTYTQEDVTPETFSYKELRSGFVWGNYNGVYGHNGPKLVNERVATSYVTGSHAVKVGIQLWHASHWTTNEVTGNGMTLQLLDGAPRQVTVYAVPIEFRERTKGVVGLFAQDQWKLKDLVLNVGVRFDHWNAFVPENHLLNGPFVPPRDFPALYNVPNTKDVSPRFGLAWDVRGNGKTAVKANIARYLEGTTLGGITRTASPVSASVTSTTRPWTDSNNDFVPQESELGALANSSFGKSVVRTRYAPDALSNRGNNWEFEASIQHELLPRVSVLGGYFRRIYANFTTTDNVETVPGDFEEYCITAPVDSRLPGGGGNQICGLFDVKPAQFSRFDNVITLSKNFGTQHEIYDGIDFNLSARLQGGASVAGGTSWGRVATDTCFVVDSPQALRFCKATPPLQAQVKLLAVYPLPWWGLETSATFQSLPGPQILANYTATSAEIRPTLGRNLSSGATGTAIVPLVEPGTMFGDRLNQLDFRGAKTVRIKKVRMQGQVEIFNLLNTSPVLQLNFAYSAAAWQRPTQVLQGRLLKFGVQMSF